MITKLKYLRMAKGLSQTEVAHQLGMSNTHLSRLENGLSKNRIEKLREIFGDEWTWEKLMEEVQVK